MSSSSCPHTTLLTTPSPNAALAGYTQPAPQKRVAATTASGRAHKDAQAPSPWTFPAPLILPEDELSFDPSYPPQSFRSWKQEKERNPVTPERKTIYIAAPPDVDATEAYIREWARSPKLDRTNGDIAQPCAKDIVEYLAAFYYPLPVRLLPALFRLTTWDDLRSLKSKSKSTPPAVIKHVALAHGDPCTRIRVRMTKQGVYTHQLNLNDLLDAAIESLPDDAYAILLLVDHDIYESDDDDFACGRAYGGSRVAVVSSARYHPGLDTEQGLEREHAWPASHCSAYVRQMCEGAGDDNPRPKKKKKKASKIWDDHEPGPADSPLQAAISALAVPPTSKSLIGATTNLLYLSRLALTSSHELGHCFGLDHCVYYACLMDGAASLAEDIRGAPYLCAICTVKVGAAGEEASEMNGDGAAVTRGKGKPWVKDAIAVTSRAELERNRRLHTLCIRWEAGDMFRAFGAWLGARIAELEEELKEE
ncbi:Archaemetzincin-1 [Tulasnella sp. JGI-2019a]|nr:Archaemetzincin-1 [Tulasnella sp. JGI-2019a]KAG8998873.1 Archaemetzincin-1 [Tulasnella sp. JGI-2019a]